VIKPPPGSIGWHFLSIQRFHFRVEFAYSFVSSVKVYPCDSFPARPFSFFWEDKVRQFSKEGPFAKTCSALADFWAIPFRPNSALPPPPAIKDSPNRALRFFFSYIDFFSCLLSKVDIFLPWPQCVQICFALFNHTFGRL